jgi:DNA gyrase subunit A
MGRSAQGVRILSIDKPDFVTGLDRIVKEDDAEQQAAGQTAAPADPTTTAETMPETDTAPPEETPEPEDVPPDTHPTPGELF